MARTQLNLIEMALVRPVLLRELPRTAFVVAVEPDEILVATFGELIRSLTSQLLVMATPIARLNS